MCGSMVEIQSPTAEIIARKQRKKEGNHRAKNGLAYYIGRPKLRQHAVISYNHNQAQSEHKKEFADICVQHYVVIATKAVHRLQHVSLCMELHSPEPENTSLTVTNLMDTGVYSLEETKTTS